MFFSDWLSGLRTSRPVLRVRKHQRDAMVSAAVRMLEPRLLLSAQPITPVDDSAAIVSQLEAQGAVVDAIPPVNPDLLASFVEPIPAEGPFPDDQTFLLHSRPGATKVIYLDFNGHTTTGTAWNNAQRPTIVSPEFDFEGGAGTFTANELTRIQQIWQRVEEAFSPFDVDVTTEEPTIDDLRNTGAGDNRWGIRVVIGGESQQTLGISAGGVAFLGSFDWNSDTPTFVFPLNLGPNSEKFIADATVHEVGHTLTLDHDGRSIVPPEEYYGGHGTGATGWAPHMGVGYSRQLVQWSKGEYPSANNIEDDLNAIVTQNGFGYRPDDHGGSSGGASSLMVDSNGVVSDRGVIEQTNDHDWFRFNTAGSVTLNINPAVRGAMLDILAEIYDSNGVLVASSNPVDALTASFSTVLPVGTYYLKIDGTGKEANGADFGYSDYGSIGQYFITGNIQLQPNHPPAVDDQNFTVPENSAVGTVVGTVVAVDPNPGQVLTYAITAGNTNSTFAINATTGQITVNDPSLLNFEVPVTFNLTVRVTDDGTPVLSDTAAITISVTDVNEPPVVTGFNVSVIEQPPTGTSIGTLSATDPDAGQSRTWSITAGNTGNAFAINAQTGQITVATPGAILFTTTPVFTLTVQAADNGTPSQSGTTTVTVNVLDVNLPPVIDDQSFTLVENAAQGTVVGTVAAGDPDAGQSIRYAITGGNAGGALSINAQTGELTVANAAALDFETSPTLTLTVTVTDSVVPPASDSATITINLTNANDPPQVNPATFTVIEFTPNGSVVGTVTASDQDAGQSFTYAITGGNVGNAFAINATTGAITIADTTKIDFQVLSSYTLTITATDNGNPAAMGTGVVTINVSDVNRPPFLPDQAFRVFERSPAGTLIGTVFSSDPDVGQPQVYAIVGGNTGNAFALDAATGKLTVNNPAAIDFETTPEFNLTVEVRDNSLLPHIRTANMRVEVLDIVEQPIINPQTFTISENRPAGYVIGHVQASHVDPARTLTFAITGGNADGLFAIDVNTGLLTVARPILSYETRPEVTLTVTVTDDATPAESRSASITIQVNDLNEAPVFPPAAFTISENRPIGYIVGTVRAYDQDLGQSLKYAIVSGNVGGAFALDTDTGVLTVATGLINYEATPQYQLTVVVTDNGTPVQSRASTVTIDVRDLNEAPVFPPQSFTISENRPIGYLAGPIAAFDQDVGQTLTFAITGGNADGIFDINAQGQLVVAKPYLNFEAQNAYQLQVSVSDNGTPQQTRYAPIHISVRDLNEAPFVSSPTFTIDEKLPAGTVVGTVTAFDQDIGQALQFAITAGNTGNAFAINANTGQITVASSQALVYDTTPEFTLGVTVMDTGSPTQSRTGTVKIKLQKVNNKPVVPNQRLSVLERSPAGTDIGTVTATDVENHALRFAITGGNTGNAFAINAVTGKITVNNPAAINFETKPVFQLTVSATDNGTPVQVGTGLVIIDVINANDPPVVLNQTFQVAENVTANTIVGTVVATDPEGSTNLKYEIVGGNPNNAFNLDPNTGIVRVATPVMFDFEANPQLSFQLKVSDDANPAASSTATMTFQLINQNDAPVVPNQSFSVARTANNGATVGSIVASDQDAGQSLKYEIVGGNQGTAFGVNLNTGMLFVANRNALAGRQSIAVTVKVTDSGPGNLSTQATISVTITNGSFSSSQSSRKEASAPAATTPGSQTVSVTEPLTTSPRTEPDQTVFRTTDNATNALLQRAIGSKTDAEGKEPGTK